MMGMFEREPGRGTRPGADGIARDQSGGAPGKTTLVERAEAGVSGAPGPLPHADKIQPAFGPTHDVSTISAYVGGGAAEATRAIGAEAYATGDSVAFGEAPSLHTAAHEAAHVMQQRGGVQLLGGIDGPNDAYERHADEVADRVVAGRSAADLLPQGGTRAGRGRIPISELQDRSFHTVENRRLRVNRSVKRYQNELQYLASVI